MRKAEVYFNDRLAGLLEETEHGYRFRYEERYLDESTTAISLTLPKQKAPFESPTLFSFFYGLLAEGALKQDQCRKLRLDGADHFGRLIKTTHSDTIGPVSLKEVTA